MVVPLTAEAMWPDRGRSAVEMRRRRTCGRSETDLRSRMLTLLTDLSQALEAVGLTE